MTSTNGTGNGPDRDSHQPNDNQYGFDYTESDATELTSAQRFEKFHSENPHVYSLLVMLARRWMKSTGQHKLGIRTLWERMRWELQVTTSAEDYRLNDHYTSFYARLIANQEADLTHLFELRRSPEADAWITGRAA